MPGPLSPTTVVTHLEGRIVNSNPSSDKLVQAYGYWTAGFVVLPKFRPATWVSGAVVAPRLTM